MRSPKNFLVVVRHETQFSDYVHGPYTKDHAFLRGMQLSALGRDVQVFATSRPELFKDKYHE